MESIKRSESKSRECFYSKFWGFLPFREAGMLQGEKVPTHQRSKPAERYHHVRDHGLLESVSERVQGNVLPLPQAKPAQGLHQSSSIRLS